MIEQTFYFENRKILNIYHKGFPNYPLKRELEEQKGALRLIEKRVNAQELKFSFKESVHGFLPSNSLKNPYRNYSCNYRELIVSEKDEELIKDDLLVNINQFKKVAEFVKEWSGYNLKEFPMSLNNILYFEPTQIELDYLKSEDKKSLNIKVTTDKNFSELMYIVKFKKYDSIFDTKINITKERKIAFKTYQKWDLVDVEVYFENEIIYAYYDLSFIEEMNFNMNLVDRQTSTNLELIDKEITLQKLSQTSFQIGKSTKSEYLRTYFSREQRIKRQLDIKSEVVFLKTNEYEKGLEILSDISEKNGYTEMWIFDPYFIEYGTEGGKKRINDILKILGKNLGVSKKIIFEKDKGDFKEFRRAVNPTIMDLKNQEVIMDFMFIETKEHFHDRFIFLRNEANIMGYLFGTSFNSLGDNYSTVVKLNPFDSEIIFNILVTHLVSEENINFKESLVNLI